MSGQGFEITDSGGAAVQDSVYAGMADDPIWCVDCPVNSCGEAFSECEECE